MTDITDTELSYTIIPPAELPEHKNPEWFDEQAYHKKLAALNDLSAMEYFDNPLYDVLKRLYKLPLNSAGSCSWATTEQSPDTLEQCCPAHVLMSEDEPINQAAKGVQERFRQYLPELEQAINSRLGDKKVVELIAQRFMGRDEQGTPKYVSVINEQSDIPLHYNVIFKVVDDHALQTRGREILTAIWQEFYKYLGRFDGEEREAPTFNNGDDFIKKLEEPFGEADTLPKAA